MGTSVHPGEARELNASRVVITSPAPRDVWQDVLLADREALVFQSPAWIDSICATGEYADASRLYEFRDGPRMVLPMVRRRGLPHWLAIHASPPHGWGYGGLISATPVHGDEMATVFGDLTRLPGLQTSIRPNPMASAGWEAVRPPSVIANPTVAHVLDLDGGADQVWKGFKSEARTAVRRAERSGLIVECCTSGRLMPVFHELYRKSVDRWAQQQHEPMLLARWRASQRDPLEKFQLIAEQLRVACRVWVAWLDGRPAAAILVLQGNNASYTRGAMDKDLAGPSRANDLLHWLAIKDACEAGCRYYHMGESGSSVSLSRYKERFGARAVPFAQIFLERLPITPAARIARHLVKRLIRFRDTANS